VQGLHDGELHAVGQVVQDEVEFPERGQTQVFSITRQASLSLLVKARSWREKHFKSELVASAFYS